MATQATNPVLAAKECHKLLGWTSPNDFTLEEMANAMGVIIKEIPIKGSEGRILIKGDSGIISVNSNIQNSGKKNFVIAHELGHFILHKHITGLFSDTQKTLSDWHVKGPHEKEANDFASELLMPSDLFKSKVAGKKLNISLIEEVASFFKVSLTATFLKYRTLGSFPVMIIYIDDGIVKWKQSSDDFPFQFLQINSSVPTCTVAGDFYNGNGIESIPEKVNAIDWFPEDRQIKYKKDWKLWEQCFPVSEKGIVSCLWTY